MDISQDVYDLPGNIRQYVYKLQPQQDLEFQKQDHLDLSPPKIIENEMMLLDKMATIKTTKMKPQTWAREIPQWNHKDDKDTLKRERFDKSIVEIKKRLGNVFTVRKQEIKELEETVQNIKQQQVLASSPQPNKVQSPQCQQNQLKSPAQQMREQKYNLMKQIELTEKSQPAVQLNINPSDVYTLPIPVSNLLALFKNTFDYKTSVVDYVCKFQQLSTIQSSISKVLKTTAKNKIVFRSQTVEGLIRTKELNRADMFNRQLSTAFEQMISMCCGAFYLPDKYFMVAYEDLPEHIKKLLTIRMMKDKTKKKLIELIGCGESVNYLTFEMDVYNKFLIDITAQFKANNTWEPFKYYAKAVEFKKTKDRTKGVAPFYKRCGYEMRLIQNAEKVLLYFIFSLVLAQKQKPQLFGSEFVIFKDKVQDCIVRFEGFNASRTDELWTAVNAFVEKRTGGIKIEEVNYEEGAEQKEVEIFEDVDRFEFAGYGISYRSGKVYVVGQDEEDEEDKKVRMEFEQAKKDLELKKIRDQEEKERLEIERIENERIAEEKRKIEEAEQKEKQRLLDIQLREEAERIQKEQEEMERQLLEKEREEQSEISESKKKKKQKNDDEASEMSEMKRKHKTDENQTEEQSTEHKKKSKKHQEIAQEISDTLNQEIANEESESETKKKKKSKRKTQEEELPPTESLDLPPAEEGEKKKKKKKKVVEETVE
ncbi:Conserved_hypothetical protein [Hexamita inflata]|uniref:Uncharacterized protein n=1 Tax=Hexamita inflata TaxID=28002 RepID=A0AA86R200_9EUKA|nr:Conserved hypothetical protein [Hexamita inflata]